MPSKKKTFVIKEDDTYYLVDGKMLTYNKKKADESGNPQKKKGVEDMETDFSSASKLEAADFTTSTFSGVNTGSINGNN